MFMRIALILTALLIPAVAAKAQSGGNPYAQMIETRILPGWRAADGRHMAGVEIRLAPGWKTYWRAPGDAGIPPLFDWSGSQNLGHVALSWPTPEVFRLSGTRTIGYENSVVLPIAVSPRRPGAPVQLKASINLGICRDVCVPVQIEIGETLRAETTRPDPVIAAALADRPFTAREAGLQNVACIVAPTPDGVSLEAEFTLPTAGGREMAVVEPGDPMIWASEPRIHRKGGRLFARFDLMHASGGPFALDRSALRFTIFGASHSVDIQGCDN